MGKLEKSGFGEAYCQYWCDQEAADYIEEFKFSPDDYAKYNWLTHRPIFKTDEQSTMKFCGVFNCSLKAGGPSLNYPSNIGINIMADM